MTAHLLAEGQDDVVGRATRASSILSTSSVILHPNGEIAPNELHFANLAAYETCANLQGGGR